jgi:hypothetical protein
MTVALDWIAWLGIVGSIASVIGLLYAFIVARHTEPRKLLAYEVTHPLPLASVLPDRVEHRLSVVYEREGSPPVNVRGAFVRFIQLGNFGREAVRREDIANADPLRIEIRDARVLDVAIAGASRPVIEFALGPTERVEELEGDTTTIPVSFAFLDHRDSAIVRVLTDSARTPVAVRGTIIGMPEGIVIVQT